MKSTFYFSHDYNANNDEKILELRSELWMEWYWIYWYLIEKLASNWGYLSLDKIKWFAYDLHIDNSVITRVITKFNLFIIDENNKFFNKRIIEHLEQINDKKQKKSEAWKKWMSSRWQSRIKKDNSVITEDNILNKIKLNKIKLNIKKNISKDIEKKEIITTEVVTLKNKIKKEFTSEFIDNIYKKNNITKIQFIEICESFVLYWTEKNEWWKKERWEMQKVFDVKRRFQTRMRNSSKWNLKKQNYEIYSF